MYFYKTSRPVTDVWIGKAKNRIDDHTANWSNPANWSRGVPRNGDNVVFKMGESGGAIDTKNDLNNLYLGSIALKGGPDTGLNVIIVDGNSIRLSKGIVAETGAISSSIDANIILTNNETFTVRGNLGMGNVNVGTNNLRIKGGGGITINELAGSGTVTTGNPLYLNHKSPSFTGTIKAIDKVQISGATQ
jgi:hypothetical protein